MGKPKIPGEWVVPRDEFAEPLDPRGWLAACRERASERLPSELYKDLEDELWSFMPYGHRLTVLRVPPDETYGSLIVIPEAHRQQNACGWVLTVGVDVCVPASERYPSVCPKPHPLEWVGCKVIFGDWAGEPIRFTAHSDSFGQQQERIKVVMLTAGDIHGEVLG